MLAVKDTIKYKTFSTIGKHPCPVLHVGEHGYGLLDTTQIISTFNSTEILQEMQYDYLSSLC